MPNWLNPVTPFKWARDQLFDDPAKEGMPYLDKIAPTITPGYQPYINRGNAAGDMYQQGANEQMNDPNAIINRIGAGYEKSPGYDWRMQQGQQAMTNANAAGGMAGTQQHLQQAGDLAGKMASEDYNKYMDRGMGLYNQGFAGQGDMYKTGYGATNDLATNLAQALMSQGQMAYGGAQQRNENTSGLINTIGKAAGAFFGGGG